MPEQLMLFTIPTICELIACQPISTCCSNFDHLAKINHVDSVNSCGSLEVDILIGSYQYWELVTGETQRGSCGPRDHFHEVGVGLVRPHHCYSLRCSCCLPHHAYSTC